MEPAARSPMPGQPYYFTAVDDHLPINLKIGYFPTAGGEDITVNVMISDIIILIAPRALVPAKAGVAYEQVLTATGDAQSYVLTSPQVPAGMTLTTDGIFRGTPPAAVNQTFVVRATDPSGNFVDQTYNWIVG